MKKYLFLLLSVFTLSCVKNESPNVVSAAKKAPTTSTVVVTDTLYTIQAGAHYSDQNTFKQVKGTTMSFTAKFDSSCIYTSIDPVNQYDINKLWGFTESVFSTANSARVGWNWRDGALRLRPYTHVNGVQSIDPPEVIVPIGANIPCSITVSGNTYKFNINGTLFTMPRGVTTSSYSGVQQYPYFGGDEVAPHLIKIVVK